MLRMWEFSKEIFLAWVLDLLTSCLTSWKNDAKCIYLWWSVLIMIKFLYCWNFGCVSFKQQGSAKNLNLFHSNCLKSLLKISHYIIKVKKPYALWRDVKSHFWLIIYYFQPIIRINYVSKNKCNLFWTF